jgi:hypothetical protein
MTESRACETFGTFVGNSTLQTSGSGSAGVIMFRVVSTWRAFALHFSGSYDFLQLGCL